MFWAFVLFLFTVDLCGLVSSADEHRYKGDSFTIRCPPPQQDAVGISLYTRREAQRQVLYYYFETGDLTVHKDYKDRVNISLDGQTLTSNIWNLQLNDAGAYWCSCIKYFEKCEMTDKGVFLFVNVPSGEASSSTAKQTNGMNDFLILVTALTAGSVLLLLLLLFGVWLVPKIKIRIMKNTEREEKTSASGVYEVMNVHRSRDV